MFFIAIILIAGLFTVSAFAAENHPMDHGTTSDAAVSDEVDRTEGLDNRVSTKFFIHIPADPVSEDIPNMGDIGVDLDQLLLITIGVGIAYLICNHYANSDPKARKSS